MALYEAALLFGTLVAETILASVQARAHKQAGHMDASDLIKVTAKTPCKEGAVHICLQVTLKQRLRSLAPGLTPRSVLDKMAVIQMVDVHLPTTDGRTVTVALHRTGDEPSHPAPALENQSARPAASQGGRR